MRWTLVGITEPITGQTIVIERDMLIGRHQQADIVLQEGHVSRRHAALLLKENGQQLWIQDLESSNGTFVNDEKVSEQQLFPEDEVSFQSIRFQVQASAVEAESDVLDQLTDLSSLDKVVPSDEGMPTLEERSQNIEVNKEGMPQNMGVPKPAPIPEHIDVNAPVAKTENTSPQMTSASHDDVAKNSKVGLMTLVVLIVLIALATIMFVMN